jgi:hypothetical protein
LAAGFAKDIARADDIEKLHARKGKDGNAHGGVAPKFGCKHRMATISAASDMAENSTCD